MNIDIIGTIYTHGKMDKYGNWIIEPEPVTGFHVNTNDVYSEFAQYEVFPNTPRRTFAGVETHCLKFKNEKQFKEVMAAWLPDEPVE